MSTIQDRLGKKRRTDPPDAVSYLGGISKFKLAAVTLLYPSEQIIATIDGIDALATGKTENPGALLVGSSKN